MDALALDAALLQRRLDRPKARSHRNNAKEITHQHEAAIARQILGSTPREIALHSLLVQPVFGRDGFPLVVKQAMRAVSYQASPGTSFLVAERYVRSTAQAPSASIQLRKTRQPFFRRMSGRHKHQPRRQILMVSGPVPESEAAALVKQWAVNRSTSERVAMLKQLRCTLPQVSLDFNTMSSV